MQKDKKDKKKKAEYNTKPAFYNDQLGENATEHFSDQYDNKQNNKKNNNK
ncbi:MAG: hypothetical protein GX783_04885 [Clostridiales bacterium]|nr:hypothetical protein [Clostridiales bacterium]